jgi:hypothetical protein
MQLAAEFGIRSQTHLDRIVLFAEDAQHLACPRVQKTWKLGRLPGPCPASPIPSVIHPTISAPSAGLPVKPPAVEMEVWLVRGSDDAMMSTARANVRFISSLYWWGIRGRCG